MRSPACRVARNGLQPSPRSNVDPIECFRVNMKFWTFVVDLTAGKVVRRWKWSYWFEVLV